MVTFNNDIKTEKGNKTTNKDDQTCGLVS